MQLCRIKNLKVRRLVIICIFLPCVIIGGLSYAISKFVEYVVDIFKMSKDLWAN